MCARQTRWPVSEETSSPSFLTMPLASTRSLSVAARVCSAMRTPFTVAGRDFIVKASVGVAMADQPDTPSEKLLQDADVAVYAVEDAGGD